MVDPHHEKTQPDLVEAGNVHEPRRPSDDFVRSARLRRVVDGDTLEVEIDLGWATTITDHIRLARLNTPEKRGPERVAGEWVTEQVRKWFGDYDSPGYCLQLHSFEFKVGKFGRCVCDVWSDAGNLNFWILQNHWAWHCGNDGQIIGDRNIDRLSGIPDAIRDQVRVAA